MIQQTAETKLLFANLKEQSFQNSILSIHSKNFVRALLAFATDWTMIFIAMVLSFKSLYFLPITLVIVGSRQRALSNLVHDAAHINLSSNKIINDFLANFFAAFVMFDTVQAYRKSHLMHHSFLGNQNLDPDSITHLNYGYDDRRPEASSRAFLRILINAYAWRDSFIGNIRNVSLVERIKIITWWIGALILIAALTSNATNLAIVSIWFFSRGSTYHFIRLFAEFLDHTGLPTETTLKFTRNLPHSGLMAMIFHPHQDTYHLAHHIFMGVPHFRLKEAHSILMRSELYKSAHHCDSYFRGTHSALKCWLGHCSEAKR